MRAQIRLADRMGLLVGPHLSRVQVGAAYYCEIDAEVRQQERDRQEFKYVLLQSGHMSLHSLFPELAPDDAEEGEEEEVQDFETPGEGETIIYKFPKSDLTPEEMEAELAEMMAGLDGTVSGGDLYG